MCSYQQATKHRWIRAQVVDLGFFFFCPIHVSVVTSSREANVPQQIYKPPSHTLQWHLWGQTNQLCFLPVAHEVIPPHTGHPSQAARRAKLLFPTQSILRGLHCKAKEVLKEDTHRLILQLASNPRKLKKLCPNSKGWCATGILASSHHSNQIAKLSVSGS